MSSLLKKKDAQKFYRGLTLRKNDDERFEYAYQMIDVLELGVRNIGSIFTAHKRYVESLENQSSDTYNFPELKKFYRKVSEDSYQNYFLVYADSAEQAKRIMSEHVDIRENLIYSAYDCTGRWFNYEMDFRLVGNGLVLCKQWHGMDV